MGLPGVHCEKPNLLRSEIMPQRGQMGAQEDQVTAGQGETIPFLITFTDTSSLSLSVSFLHVETVFVSLSWSWK